MSKGSRNQAELRPRVVYDRPNRRLAWLMAALVVAGALLIAYFAGGWYQQQQNISLRAERDQLLLARAQLSSELTETRQQLVLAQQGSRVDREAAEQLRQQILLQQTEQAELEKTLTFYQRVLAPELGVEGVQISQLELRQAAQANWFYYRLVLTQNAKRARVAKGDVKVFVGGLQGQEPKEWSLDTLAPSLEANRQPFSFRYFQVLPASEQLGLIQLPDGVEPLYVRVELKQQGKRTLLERKFSWVLKESL